MVAFILVVTLYVTGTLMAEPRTLLNATAAACRVVLVRVGVINTVIVEHHVTVVRVGQRHVAVVVVGVADRRRRSVGGRWVAVVVRVFTSDLDAVEARAGDGDGMDQ